ncbi:hypothetical protein OSC27_11175 [Microbacterium sp. STN6]|uniref:hypothetical protein n=1 Tax=Microbacterium sp. STN6 TaxID=2995588 RepID=UPI00226089FC|nr:hypothetical protein [Microbacterium sp. STN6]MCX7522836.1 hypothetical protein [Microbacterium sp. STN6]
MRVTIPPPVVTSDEAEFVIGAIDYTLVVQRDRPRALLFTPDGYMWSELSLVANVDRIDAPDESTAPQAVEVFEKSDHVQVVFSSASSAWQSRTVTLVCTRHEVRASVVVTGRGRIGDVTLLGGRAVLPSGAAGQFRSGIGFASLFVPTPTNPVSVVRPSAVPAQIGVVGDAEPGRLHGIFSPPPLCFAFGRHAVADPTSMPAGEWLGAGIVGPVQQLGFTTARYDALDGGFLLRLAYEGHTEVTGAWRSPEVVLKPAGSPLEAIEHYRNDLQASGWVPQPKPVAPWAHEPLFCGWGAQCAHAAMLTRTGHAVDAEEAEHGFVMPAGAGGAPDLARQELYDRWLARLDAHELRPGTIVIDDRWQAEYGTNTVDTEKWPDLKGWIAQKHAAGQKVLLWFKAWDPAGLPPELCVRDAAGTPVSVDPSNPGYLSALRDQVAFMLSPHGLDADGFKLDFTQRAPSGASLLAHGDGHAESNGVWGLAGLYALVAAIHEAATAAKPDSVVVTHTVHPSFGGVADMIRLNDVLEFDATGARVSVVEQLRFRHAVAAAAMPEHPIDTDQWPMPDRDQWLAYAKAQTALGVPALYYVDSIDNSGESITDDDLASIAAGWRDYRAGLAAAGAVTPKGD